MENISIQPAQQAPSFAGVAAPRTEVQQAQQQLQQVVDTKTTQDKSLDGSDQEQARFDAVKKASIKVVSTNPLSPSSARFTIYRDTLAEGIVFVTRFTSLSDGKVTTVREPELLANFSKNQGTIVDGMA